MVRQYITHSIIAMIWIAFAYPSRSVFAILILNKKNMTKIKLDGTESNSEDSVLNRNGLYLNCCSIWFHIFDRYLCSKLPNMFVAFDKQLHYLLLYMMIRITIQNNYKWSLIIPNKLVSISMIIIRYFISMVKLSGVSWIKSILF